MSSAVAGTRTRTLFDRVYVVGVAFKGVDGLVELVGGLLLWLAPGVIRTVLQGSSAEAGEHASRFSASVADALSRADLWVATQSAAGVIVFLLVHGVVKVVTVVCLLARWIRAYPWALAALLALTAVQAADVVVAPGVSKVLLTLLDLIVIALVLREYATLRRETGRRPLGQVLHVGRAAR